ncbi:hypothetical protein L1049_002477 [Liquidambar formosana]|uniref:Uncharacterized protein n=1 Tax=Liquidambar formosana TaxID=63359 RepID=A0AAP0NG38_LIQFO
MESLGDGVDSTSKNYNSSSEMGYNPSSISAATRPSRPPPLKQSRNEETSSASYATATDHGMKMGRHPTSTVKNQKHSYKTVHDHVQQEEFPNSSKHSYQSNKGKPELMVSNDVLNKTAEVSSQKQVSMVETKSCIKHLVDDSQNSNLSGFLETKNFVSGPCKGGTGQVE